VLHRIALAVVSEWCQKAMDYVAGSFANQSRDKDMLAVLDPC
jgi:hypothetical protein